MKSTLLLYPLLALGLLFSVFCDTASALTKEQRDALRAAKGKYKLTFTAAAKLTNTMTMESIDIPVSGTGTIKMPKKKGTAPVVLYISGSPLAFNAIITKVSVKRNGKSVSYRGAATVPNSTLGLGDLTGPFRGTVKLKKTKETLKASAIMTGIPSMDAITNLSANLKGKKK